MVLGSGVEVLRPRHARVECLVRNPKRVLGLGFSDQNVFWGWGSQTKTCSEMVLGSGVGVLRPKRVLKRNQLLPTRQDVSHSASISASVCSSPASCSGGWTSGLGFRV
jgi:hypothetical protein